MPRCTLCIPSCSLKHVPVCEYYPYEAIKTNIHGTQNVIEASTQMQVEKLYMFQRIKQLIHQIRMG